LQQTKDKKYTQQKTENSLNYEIWLPKLQNSVANKFHPKTKLAIVCGFYELTLLGPPENVEVENNF
jgi:hypothetical protein